MPKEFDCLKHCPDLGYCCRDFSVYFKNKVFNRWTSEKKIEAYLKSEGFPFKVIGFNSTRDMWSFTCKKLGNDGRCADHKNRPQICRDFKPRSEELCCIPREKIGEGLGNLIVSFWRMINTEKIPS